MKVAVSSSGKGMESQMDVRFGRCPYYIIAEGEGKDVKEIESIENPAISQSGGAGITAAQFVANKGVKAVISGAFGPKAFQMFQQLGMEIYQGKPGTVGENLKAFADRKLEKLGTPTGPMFMGQGGGMGQGRGAGRRFQ